MRVRMSRHISTLVLVSTTISGPTIETLRVARGLRQGDVATKLGIAQGSVSKLEAGLATLDPIKLIELAEVLHVQPALLQVPIGPAASDCTHFRRRASLKVGDANQVRAELALRAVVLGRLRSLVDAPQTGLSRVAPDAATPPRDVARLVRAQMGVPNGPIADLFAVIESAGCFVTTIDAPDIAFDAASTWVRDEYVTALVNSARPGDRMRFTTAHELGHAVMHEMATPTSEREADEFASEFLMPAKQIVAELAGLSFDRLGDLKTRWKVSMAAIARRAFDLDVVTERQYKSLMIELSKAGYRTTEPLSPPAETPRVAASMAAELLDAGQSLSDLTKAVGLTDSDELANLIAYNHRQEP